jgi:kynurenine 3-monooxygenase
MGKMVISGAGLVGSLLAYTLKNRGFEVELYEKREDMRRDDLDGGRSINLIVTSRGMNALKEVGLLEEVLAITVPVMGRMMHDRKGKLTYQPYGRDDSECNYSISRGELNKLLLTKAEEAGVKIIFENELLNIDFEKNIAQFSDAKNISFDQFFGCDGAASPTRKAMIDAYGEEGESLHWVEWLGSEYKELLMPADSNGEYQIEKNALHIWPRGSHMLMALPNQGGSFTMTLYNPEDSEYSFDNFKSREEVEKHFKEEYPDAISLMPEYQKEYLDNPNGKLGTVRMKKWFFQDKAILLGDAAHAVVPFFGQGMNCGFEDIFYLTRFMDHYKNDWEKVFKDYDRIMRPNGNAIADMAIENFTEMKDKVGAPGFLLRKKVETLIEKNFSDCYRSRYGMVTYTLIPYLFCQEIGLIQNEILDELCEGISVANEVDMKKAEMLINEKYLPYIEKRKIQIERYRSTEKTWFSPVSLLGERS